MINFNSYDTLGKSGMALMQSSMNTASKAAERLSSTGVKKEGGDIPSPVCMTPRFTFSFPGCS